jgi:hypothetical protein
MQNKRTHILLLLSMAALLCSCASRKVFSTHYYTENEKTLTSIEELYKNINQQKHFSVAFTDKSFEYISLEILTDSIKYIYEFNIREPRLQDTLVKYGLPAKRMMDLISQMNAIHCIWINNLDYYVNNERRSLVFMSIRQVAAQLPFTSEKYYVLTFYPQPQYFDKEGRLLAGRRLRKLRIINGDIFYRINDKVCYTVSEQFR